jgi:HEAT repeat protein
MNKAYILSACLFGSISSALSACAQESTVRFLPSYNSNLKVAPSDARDFEESRRQKSDSHAAIQAVLNEMRTAASGSKGKLVPALLQTISSADENTKSHLHFYIRDEASDPSAILALVQALSGKDAESAARVLSVSSRYAVFSLPTGSSAWLLQALSSHSPVVRQNVVAVLGRDQSKDPAVKPALIKALETDDTAAVRKEAAYSLGSIGREEYFKHSATTVAALSNALEHDSDPEVRAHAALAFGMIGQKAGPGAKALTAALRDDSSSVRFRVLESLGKIGPEASIAITELVDILNGPDERLGMGSSKYYACYALEQIGPTAKNAVPSLVKILKEPDMARSAASALAGIGPAAAPAVPDLIALLKQPNYDKRDAAARALGAIGPKAKVALPDLEMAANDDSNELGAGNTNSAKRAAREAILKIRQ